MRILMMEKLMALLFLTIGEKQTNNQKKAGILQHTIVILLMETAIFFHKAST